jgi:hypothetical protein
MKRTGYLTIILLILCANCLLAQSVPAWGGGADLKDLSFGFSFAAVNSYYKIDKNPDWRSPFLDAVNGNQPVTGNVSSISSPYSQGFGVGFITRYSLLENLEVKINPSLIFIDKMLYYTYDTTPPISKTVSTTTVDVPLLLKLKSDRINDFRAYVIGGVKYSKVIGSLVNTDADAPPLEKLVKNVGGYASYETGLGCDIYFEFFKLSPEIKLSNSFGYVLYHENNAFSSPINKLTLHTLMFSLIFE